MTRSMNMKHTIAALCFLSIALIPLTGFAGGSFVIKKCRGANGEWYYGDTADRACARSKVIEINNAGIKTKELAAPLTPAQLVKHKKAERKARAQARRDRILLSMYGDAKDITYVRNRKIADIKNLISGENDTLKSLAATLPRLEAQESAEASTDKAAAASTAVVIADTKAQIATHEANIKNDEQAITQVRKQAASDLIRYRKLRGIPQSATATP